MNIKNRLIKLEACQQDKLNGWVRMIVKSGESEQTAIEKWQSENPGEPLPELLIVRVIMNHTKALH